MKRIYKKLSCMFALCVVFFVPQVSASKLTMAQVNGRSYTLSQRGDPIQERTRARTALEMISIDATGYSIQPGQSVTVNVNTIPSGNYPRIYFQSFEANTWPGWIYHQQLAAGLNTITLPGNHPGAAAIFFQNQFLPGEQGSAPVVTLGGGIRHPIYIHGETDPTAFRTEVNNHSGNNIAVAVSDNAVVTTSNTGMKSGLELTHGRGYSINDVMDGYEKLYREFNTTLSGYDMDAPFGTGDSPRGGKVVATSFAGVGYVNGAAAGSGLTGYNSSNTSVNPGGAGALVNYPDVFQRYTVSHEMGHQWEPRDLRVTNGKTALGTESWSASEITNLIHQEYAQYIFGTTKTQFDSRWDDPFGQGIAFLKYHVNKPNPIVNNIGTGSREEQTWMAIVIYQILLAYDYEAFGRAARDLRLNPGKYTRVEEYNQINSSARWENMILSLSNAVGYDLTPHFAHYHITVSQAAKEKAGVHLLPQDNRKTYYAVPVKNRQPSASAFKNHSVDVTISGNTVDITGAEADEILCYEIYNNGTLAQVVVPANGQTKANFNALGGTVTAIAYDRAFQPHTNIGDIFTISFNTMGGSDILDKQVVSGQKLSKPIAPTKTGFIFAGWFIDEIEFDFNTPITQNITLTAKWTPETETSIIRPTKSDNRYGIRFVKNIVSDKVEISVVLPDGKRASKAKIVVYDMTGNVVFVGANPRGCPFVWNLTNNAGRFVANGTYLVITEIKDQNGKAYHYSAKLGVKN